MQSLISAKVIADSVSEDGARITTFEIEYPRIIHSELMTHRLFSRNAMSSRAIPIKKMIEQILEEPAMPVRFGANQPGMQDKGSEHDAIVQVNLGGASLHMSGRDAYRMAGAVATEFAKGFDEAGYHKQIGNRLLEAFQRMKTIVTATDWNNFFWLRVDPDADPTIYELSRIMKNAMEESEPELLKPGMWHTPYVDHIYGYEPGSGDYDKPVFEGYCVLDENDKPIKLTVEEAKAISASCCAQVSYRRLVNTKDKALDIYTRLLSGNKVHASPFEHQATPMAPYWVIETSDYDVIGYVNQAGNPSTWQDGITHADRFGQLWSGNLRGWVQHRQLLSNHAISG